MINRLRTLPINKGIAPGIILNTKYIKIILKAFNTTVKGEVMVNKNACLIIAKNAKSKCTYTGKKKNKVQKIMNAMIKVGIRRMDKESNV